MSLAEPRLVSSAGNPAPPGAVTGLMTAADGVRLRFARVPAIGPVRGTVCVLHGRAEFIEKYFEIIADLRQRGFAVALLDWRGQGGSQRLLPDPRKGHVQSFADYQQDLAAFMHQIVLPDCPPPYYGLGHSMGGLVLLLALRKAQTWFERVVISAPLIDFGPHYPLQRTALRRLGGMLDAVGAGSLYIPGGGPTSLAARPFAGNPLTSDAGRYARVVALVRAAPHLAIGSPTIGWVHAAAKAMEAIAADAFPRHPGTPLMMTAGSADRIVSVRATERFARQLCGAALIGIGGARHEVLFERDALREQFWAAFDAFIPGER